MNQIAVKRKQIQSLISIIGAITWLVLGRVIGYGGIAYLGVAFEAYLFFLILLGSHGADVLGKMLRTRVNKNQFKNAAVVRGSVVVFQLATAVLGGVILFVLAEPVAEGLFGSREAVLALRILAPALVCRVLAETFLGLSQGTGTQMPILAADAIRYLLYLGLGFLFVGRLQAYGEKVMLLLRKDTLPAMYGAAGMAIAIAVTEIFVLVFAVLTYLGGSVGKKEKTEGLKRSENFRNAALGFGRGRSFLVLTDMLLRLPLWMNLFLYARYADRLGDGARTWGLYYGGFLMICAIPVLLGEATVHPLAARTAVAVRKSDSHHVERLLEVGFRWLITYPLLFTVLCGVMASQMGIALSGAGEHNQVLAPMLQKGCATIFLAITAAYLIRLFVYMGRRGIVVASTLLSVVSGILFVVLGLQVMKLGMDSFVYGGMVSLVFLSVLPLASLLKSYRLHFCVWRRLAIPAVGVVFSGVCGYLLSHYVTPHLGSVVTLLIGVGAILLLYTGALLYGKAFGRHELEILPGGRVLRAVKELID